MRKPSGILSREGAGAALLFGALAASCSSPQTRTIKLAHGLPPSHPVHEAMVFFAERVGERSGGALEIDVHPSEQLGTERESVELLQIGAVGMTKVSASVLEGFAPAYAVFSLPYLFRDEAHRQHVFRGPIGREILLKGVSRGLRGLAYYDAGSRSFYSKDRPVESPKDLAGMKVRTQESPLAMRMVEALGGAATPISWGELYTALQQGVVDAAENNPPSFYLSRHFEVARFYSLDEHTATPDVLLIAGSLWDEMSETERRIVDEAARESAELQLRLWREATEEALAAVRAAGVEILRPEKGSFRAAVEVLYREERNEEIRDLVRRIRTAGGGE